MTTLFEKSNIKRRFQVKNRAILKFTITGRLLAEYYSVSEAARKNSISRTAIQNALKRDNRLKCSGGYVWAYKSQFTDEELIRIYREAFIK